MYCGVERSEKTCGGVW